MSAPSNGGSVQSDEDHLSVWFSGRRQYAQAFLTNVLLLALAVWIWIQETVPRPLVAVWVALIVVWVVVAIQDISRRRRAGPVVELDSAGITVAGSPTVPWHDVHEIAVTRMAPRWLTGGIALDVVAILPKDGVPMPDPPTYIDRPRSNRVTERWRAQCLRDYGTNLTLMPWFMSASTNQITRVAQRWAEIPVTKRASQRKVRWIFLIAPTLVLIALVVPLIAILVR